MLKHNSYFDGSVQSVGYERNGRKQTVGVIATGTFHFGTDAAERMTVVSGELTVRRDGTEAWLVYPAGTAFEVPAKSGFDVRADAPSAYLCEFLLAARSPWPAQPPELDHSGPTPNVVDGRAPSC